MQQSFVGKLFWRLSVLFAVVLVTAALAATALRVLFTYAPSFRADTESILSHMLGQPVTVTSLRARWHGMHPQLVLKGVKLSGAGAANSGPTLDEVDLTLGLSIGLRGVVPRAAAITVKGLSITVERSPDGSLHLAGLEGVPLNEAGGAASRRESWPAKVELKDSDITLVDRRSNTLHRLSQVDLLLRSSGSAHRLSGTLQLPGTREGRARFIVGWSGALGGGGLDVSGYVDASDVDFGRIEAFFMPQDVLPRLRGGGDAQLWLNMKQGRLTRLSGALSLHDVGLRTSKGGPWIVLGDALTGRFDWRRTDGGWALDVDRFAYARGSSVWPASRFSVRYDAKRSAGGSEWRVAASRLQLASMARVASQFPWLSADWKSRLANMNPQGSVLDAGVRAVVSGTGRIADWSARGTLRGVNIDATGSQPGISGLAGHFQATSGGGRFDLAASNGDLQLPRLFRGPLPFGSLRGRISWRTDSGGWHVTAPDLSLASADGRLWVRLAVTDRDGQGPFADVRVHGEDGNAAHTSRYLPAGIMHPQLVDWLDHSIQGGTVTSADAIYYGAVRDFPFDNGTGVFDVVAHVRNGRFDYRRGWPALTDLTATLRFSGRQMHVSATHGTISGATVDQARASIDNLEHANLKVDANGHGSGASFLSFVKDSPLGKRIRPILDELRLGGEERLALQLGIPLGPGPVSVAGRLTLGDGTLNAPSWNLALSGLQGAVSFNSRGVDARGVKGVFRGQPIALDARTVAGRHGHRIRVVTRLRSSVAGLLGLTEADLSALRGEANWDIELDLPGFDDPPGQRNVNLALNSNLQGISSALPEPLTKPADRATAFRLDARLAGGQRIPVRLRYGGEVHAALDVSARSGHVAGAVLRFGSGGTLPRTIPPGVSLRGNLSRLDLDRWRAYLGTTAAGSAASEALPPLREVDLAVDKLKVFRQTFNRTTIHARNLTGGWQINLGGRDISGSIMQMNTPHRRIAVNLDRLVLVGGVPGAGGKAARPAKPADIPATAVDVRHLKFDGKDYGRLRFRTTPVRDGVKLEGFSLNAPALDVHGTGGWEKQGADGRTKVSISATSGAPGKALAMFDFANMVEGGNGKVQAQLQWSGSPWDVNLKNLRGNVDLTLKNGQLPKVKPGAGRIFGLLSITNLPRRLSLNFADIFDKGFAYDTIHGNFRLEKGNAYPQDFVMEGPAANVAVSGRIGLAARDYDQIVTVTPQVSSTLPIVAGLAGGGPVGAVAAFVAQKLFHKEIDRISRYRYRVTGSWDNPKVESLENKSQAGPGKEHP